MVLSQISFIAVDAVRLDLFVRETNKAHCSFSGAAVLAGPGYGVPDTSISQPASIAAIIALELPCSIKVAHLGNHCTVIDARLHSLVIGQSVWLNQPIEMT